MEFISTSSSYFANSKTAARLSATPVICTAVPKLASPLPRVQFPPDDIVRCGFCKAFINLYCEVESSEFRWRCNLCCRLNQIPASYYKYLRTTRDELSALNYEIYADDNYIKRPPMSPCFLFLIDVSSIKAAEVLEIITKSLREALSANEFNERTLVAFVLFDENVHLVCFKGGFKIVTVCVADEGVWLPVPVDDVVVNLRENLEGINDVLDAVCRFRGGNSVNLRSALDIVELLLTESGGKVFLFLFEYYLDSGHARELSLKPNIDYFESGAAKFLRINVSCDLFVSAIGYCGLVNLAQLSVKTGGEVYYYKEIISNQMTIDIIHAVTKPRGWEGILKLRVNQDWRISSIFGHFTIKNDVLLVPELSDQSYTFELYLINELTSSQFLYLQLSTLYTNEEGIRLIRVLNKKIPLTDSASLILQCINQDCLLNFYLKQSVTVMYKRDLIQAGKRYLKVRHEEIQAAVEHSIGNWPANLKYFSQDINNLLYHPLFFNDSLPCNLYLDGQDLDFFQFLRIKIESLNIEASQVWVRPLLIKIDQEVRIVEKLETGLVSEDFVYLLDNGIDVVVWIGKG